MANRCDLCDKKRRIGKSGAHKYGGKWAMRAQKKTKIWKPNVQQFTVNGKKMKLCTKCIKRVKFELKKKEEKNKKVVVGEPAEKKEPKKSEKKLTSKNPNLPDL